MSKEITLARPSVRPDMGGTTAKASLIRQGEPTMAPGYYVGGYASGHPVMVPVIDVVEVGAGGGSIAWIDEIGALKVGPQSAGADPGPICYRGGGTEPTITDANLVLGRLDPEDFLGGQMVLDAKAAAQGIVGKIADPLKMSAAAAAQAIVDIAVSKMSLAVREVSVAKGYDPRDFALVASGGAGPLHVMAIATAPISGGSKGRWRRWRLNRPPRSRARRARNAGSISICATSGRNSPFPFPSARARSGQAIAAPSERRSTGSTISATRTILRMNRSKSSISGS